MRADKLTTKATEALQAAQSLANEHGNTEIAPEHLLSALMDQPEGIVPSILKAMGVPVAPLGLPPRVAELVSREEPWVETAEAMPKPCVPATENGFYTFERSRIWLNLRDGTRKVAADTFGAIAGLAISSDRWRLYVADHHRRFVYAMAIQPDGTLRDAYAHAHLHLADDCLTLGALAICVDRQDRLYAATQLGWRLAGRTTGCCSRSRTAGCSSGHSKSPG